MQEESKFNFLISQVKGVANANFHGAWGSLFTFNDYLNVEAGRDWDCGDVVYNYQGYSLMELAMALKEFLRVNTQLASFEKFWTMDIKDVESQNPDRFWRRRVSLVLHTDRLKGPSTQHFLVCHGLFTALSNLHEAEKEACTSRKGHHQRNSLAN